MIEVAHRTPITALLLPLVLLLGACAGNSAYDGDESQRPSEAAELNTELGINYMRDGRYDLAFKRLRKALELSPNYAPAHTAMALLHERSKQYDDAERHFRRAVELAPADSTAHNNFGRFLCERGRYEQAQAQFEQALANPRYDAPHLAYANAGVCAFEAGNLSQAEDFLRKALQVDARLAAALFKMSELSMEQEKYLSARAYLQRYQEVSTPSPRSLWLGVRIERALGDRDAEAAYASELHQRFPDSPQARQLDDPGARRP